MKFKYSDKEMAELLKSMVIVVDSRENVNSHITDYFNKNSINYVTKKLDSGDYSCFIPKNQELGITRDMYAEVMIERKNSVSELASSFTDRTRFESEFIRAFGNGTKIFLLVEDGNGYDNLLKGNYRSEYDPKALLASLKSFECRYDFGTSFIDKKNSGNFIYFTLKYYLYEFLKG